MQELKLLLAQGKIDPNTYLGNKILAELEKREQREKIKKIFEMILTAIAVLIFIIVGIILGIILYW